MPDMRDFVVIGENIHCSRVFKRGGVHAVETPGGGEGIRFGRAGEDRVLEIPAGWESVSPAYADGKIKHVAVAVHVATAGAGEAAETARDYLGSLAERQIEAGATFLDVNVDEYTNDTARRVETMTWLAGFLSDRFDAPLSIDSSDAAVMAAGLAACRAEAGPHLANSVSLERTDCIDVAASHNAAAVVSAAGVDDMPTTPEARLSNLDTIIPRVEAAGIDREAIYIDPLVYPLSTDPDCGRLFLETLRQARDRYEGVHLGGGLSNVSFGMPQRKLLNAVFARLCVEAGADSGILDPVATGRDTVAALDVESEPYKLAEAFLLGRDAFGMEFIAAHREGRLG